MFYVYLKAYSTEEKIPNHKSKVQFSEDVYNGISHKYALLSYFI